MTVHCSQFNLIFCTVPTRVEPVKERALTAGESHMAFPMEAALAWVPVTTLMTPIENAHL